jgi:hypothetical protein
MHLLPLSLGRLAEHTTRHGFQYALGCVLLRLNPDNTFEAVATDARMLVRVAGPCVAPADTFPAIPEFDAAPDDRSTALIPAGAWKDAFTMARKLARPRTAAPAVSCVAVRIGETHTTFAAANEYVPWVESVANVNGRFPPYEDILAALPRARQDRLVLDPGLMTSLMETAAAFCGEDDPYRPRVKVETRGPAKPVVLRAGFGDGPRFTGILMPIAADPGEDDDPFEGVLRSAVAELLAERDALARQVAELRAALAAHTPGVG